MVIVRRQQMRMFQKFNALWRNPEWPAQQKRSHCVGSNDYRYERKEWIIDKGPGINRDLVKAKDKSYQRGEDCVQTKKR